MRGHAGGNCARLRTADTISGGTERCLSDGYYSGAGYSFRSKKRSAREDACSLIPESCTSTVAPDVLFLGDGQKYNLVDMDKGLVEELIGYMKNESVVADIPEVFKPFEIAA